MADKADTEKGAEADKGEQVRFTVSPQVWKYLEWLSKNTLLGATEHMVARQLLIPKLSKMKRGKRYKPDDA